MSNNHQLQKNNPRLEEDLALKFLDVQKQELDIRAKDFEIRKASEEHQFEYATSALKAKAEDAKNERSSKKHLLIIGGGILLVLFAMIFAFLAFAMKSGNQEIAKEVIRAIIYIMAGGSGGYAIGRNRAANKSNA